MYRKFNEFLSVRLYYNLCILELFTDWCSRCTYDQYVKSLGVIAHLHDYHHVNFEKHRGEI